MLLALAIAFFQDSNLIEETTPIHLGFFGLRSQLFQFVDSHCVDFPGCQNVGNLGDQTVLHRKIDNGVHECSHRNLVAIVSELFKPGSLLPQEGKSD